MSLLDSAVHAARPDDDRVAADPAAAGELVRLCGCLPPALGIVAALLVADPGQPIEDLVAAPGEASTRLGELAFGDSSGVHAAFDLSCNRLAPAEARLFRLRTRWRWTRATAPARPAPCTGSPGRPARCASTNGRVGCTRSSWG
ncbi:hypothetical protein [Saccharothrix lopnurensis]|uniref:Uncharacterized protein n=1 Tax=Saccharothrix lopnurensis TaxID=1670621 RepID=A0ABW1PD19_9PSEU